MKRIKEDVRHCIPSVFIMLSSRASPVQTVFKKRSPLQCLFAGAITTKIPEGLMEKSIQKGKFLIYTVIVSSIIFLVLHNNDLYFQEYGNRIVLNLFRIALLAPLLYFLYKKHNWALYSVAAISSILLISGIIGYLLFLKEIGRASCRERV